MRKGQILFTAVVVFILVISILAYNRPVYKQVVSDVQQNNDTSYEEQLKAEEEIKNAEALKIAEEIKIMEEQNKLEEAKKQEELKKLEELKKQEQAKKAEKPKTLQPVKQAPPPVKQPAPVETRLIDKIKAAQSSQQVILVQSDSFKTDRVTINTYEKVNGQWKEVLTNVSGFIGRAGFSTNRKEGDSTSPVGVFHMPYLFGWGGNPGFKMPHKPSTNDDFWLSLPDAANYNIWFHRDGGPDPSWSKSQYEVLGPAQKLYKYAAVMDFNMGSNKVVGKGSGIFLHINPTTGKGTLGCTSMPEDKLIQTLKWLDPSKNPVIIQGPVSELTKM